MDKARRLLDEVRGEFPNQRDYDLTLHELSRLVDVGREVWNLHEAGAFEIPRILEEPAGCLYPHPCFRDLDSEALLILPSGLPITGKAETESQVERLASHAALWSFSGSMVATLTGHLWLLIPLLVVMVVSVHLGINMEFARQRRYLTFAPETGADAHEILDRIEEMVEETKDLRLSSKTRESFAHREHKCLSQAKPSMRNRGIFTART